MRFEELQLINSLQRAVREQGYTAPTPIQEQAIPAVLSGRDLIGLAQTGTGKTAAFALPVLNILSNIPYKPKSKRYVQALILAPTRELASQIGDSFAAYGKYTKLKYMTIYGGVSHRPQVEKLRRGVNIVIATPGRLLDLLNQRAIRLDRLHMLVLDEADRMLDMGFLPDIQKIIDQVPEKRQTLMFSATMPPNIEKLAGKILTDPLQVSVAPESTTVEAIEQHVYFVEKSDKRKLLRHLFKEHNMHRTLVFTRTRHGANKLSQELNKSQIPSEAIHSDKSQRARQTALDRFKRGKTQVLVATDIVARGIDVDDISHVINYDLPNETESYVHRIGRTGRAGSSGIALSFCAAEERKFLVNIERLIQMHIPVISDHPYQSERGVPQPTRLDGKRREPGEQQTNGKSGGKKRSSSSRRSRNRRRNNRNGQSSQNSNGSRQHAGGSGERKRSTTRQPHA